MARGGGKDIGARDDAGAFELEGGLDTDNEVEGVAGEGMVDVVFSLGVGSGIGADEDGGVAAIDHAVVEEDTEGGGRGGRAGGLLRGDNLLHDRVKFRTCFGVVVKGEAGL